MTELNIQVDLNNLGITTNQQRVANLVADQLVNLVDPYIPFLSGDLAKSVTRISTADGVLLVWDKAYAQYVYKGYVMDGTKPKHVTNKRLHYTDTFHPKAGAEWDQAALVDNDINQQVLQQTALNALLGGL